MATVETRQTIPLEDELGDVLDKGLCLAGLTAEEAAEKAGVEVSRLMDALDWRSELGCEELTRLCRVLGLNEVGVCAMAKGVYPLPEVGGLPFCLHPLRMKHGIGVTNAYVISQCCSDRGVLFDTGPGVEALQAEWPARIRHIDAVFVTHVEAEHAGSLCALSEHFRGAKVFLPEGASACCGEAMAEGASWSGLGFKVTAMATPGHAAAHNCYHIETPSACKGRSLLVSGDLIFAGSVGCAFHCKTKMRQSISRVLGQLPKTTVIAPGHGPLTTVETEGRYNPFVR